MWIPPPPPPPLSLILGRKMANAVATPLAQWIRLKRRAKEELIEGSRVGMGICGRMAKCLALESITRSIHWATSGKVWILPELGNKSFV